MPHGRARWPFLVLTAAVIGCQAVPPAPSIDADSAPAPTPVDAPLVDPVDTPATAEPALPSPTPTPGPTPTPLAASPSPAGASPSPGATPRPIVNILGTPEDRTYIDALIPVLRDGVVQLELAAKQAQDPEFKAMAARLRPAWQVQLATVRGYRRTWFGSDSVPGEPADTSHLQPGTDFDWMCADELIRTMQSGMDATAAARQTTLRKELVQVAKDVEAWSADQTQLNDWVNAWLEAAANAP